MTQTFALKKKTTLRDWAMLIGFGVAGFLAFHLIIGIVALLIGFLVAAFTEIPWYVATLISYHFCRPFVSSCLGLLHWRNEVRWIAVGQPCARLLGLV